MKISIQNKIVDRFEWLKHRGEGALIGYFAMGGPLAPHELAAVYADSGVDVLEIGYPVEQPHLDGLVIRDSMQRARAEGWATERFFDGIAEIHMRHPSLCLQVFAYCDVFDTFAPTDFARQCGQAGADALLIVGSNAQQQRAFDAIVPPEIINLRFAPYHCDEEQRSELRAHAQGYVFLQAVDGATGARDGLAPALGANIDRMKRHLPDVPVCAGFGISRPDHCRQLRSWGADGAIVGSAIVERLNSDEPHGLAAAGRYMQTLKAALCEAL